MLHRLALALLRAAVAERRTPDVVIGQFDREGTERPYMRRWHVIPRNRWFNVYLHHFLRSDDDRALHDHPWWNLSWLLHGAYAEVVFRDPELGPEGGTRLIERREGAFAARPARHAHRILLHPLPQRMSANPVLAALERLPPPAPPEPVWTLFITGPRIRRWGFWCPRRSPAGGWRHWKDFTGYRTDGHGREVGPGCGEIEP